MSRQIVVGMLGLLIVAGFGTPPSQAADTLLDFRNTSAENPLRIHDKNFWVEDFAWEWWVDVNGMPLFDEELDSFLAGISVEKIEDDPFNPGLRFIGNDRLVIADNSYLNMFVVYAVQNAVLAPTIKDTSLDLVGCNLEWNNLMQLGPVAWISEEVLDGDFQTIAEPWVMALADPEGSVLPDPEWSVLHDEVAFAELVPSVLVATDLWLMAPEGDAVSGVVFEQRYSQVPEPASLAIWSLLVTVGGIGFSWRRRK